MRSARGLLDCFLDEGGLFATGKVNFLPNVQIYLHAAEYKSCICHTAHKLWLRDRRKIGRTYIGCNYDSMGRLWDSDSSILNTDWTPKSIRSDDWGYWAIPNGNDVCRALDYRWKMLRVDRPGRRGLLLSSRFAIGNFFEYNSSTVEWAINRMKDSNLIYNSIRLPRWEEAPPRSTVQLNTPL